MDFYRIKERSTKNGVVEIYPDFKIVRSKDLMIRGKSFYAVWDEKAQLWSTDEYDVQRLVDEDLLRYKDAMDNRDGSVQIKFMSDFSSNTWMQFQTYIRNLSDSSHQLDENLTFSNTEVKKGDYVSRRLSYPLSAGDISAYKELMAVLYEPEELAKIEWAIGAIVSGDAKHIQKFMVLYGSAGTGKSTVLNIVEKLFDGYTATFDAKALTSNSSSFATEVFRDNPLVAIQHDGDLSKIEDNSRFNSIISHEKMTMNVKFKPSYDARVNAFAWLGTNKPVKITDSKSGLIRRLIDVQPTGQKVSPRKYQTLYAQIDFELGAIAQHCLDTYRSMGKDYYSGYRPIEMMLQTDVFFNFIEAYYDIFQAQDGVTLNQAHDFYKEFCKDSSLEFTMAKYRLRDELKSYFSNFEERAMVDGVRVRSWFSGFKADRFKVQVKEEKVFSLVMDDTESIFDAECAEMPAQYASRNGTPSVFWTDKERMMKNPKTGKDEIMVPPPELVVSTILSDLDTTKLHYVKPPLNHIVIDFDLKDASGEKSAERNLEAASQWPSTYAEFSKGGNGVHLHYHYDGAVEDLSRVYDDGIEIKVFTGDSSLRRRLSKCNNIPVATISSGLPLKEKKMISADVVKSEKSLRDLIGRNLRKEIHPGTKPSIDFIHKILEDAYRSSLPYDLTDLRPKLIAFANNSSHQALNCLKIVQSMKFASEVKAEDLGEVTEGLGNLPKDDRLVFFDVEVFPNLFMVNWKYHKDNKVVRMINPSPQAIEELMGRMLVGFNCRRYDNHMLYARFMGYNNEQLYKLSKKIIDGVPNALFGEAYNISHADIYDFSSKKQSLKKFQIELGIPHKENRFPWDEPVDEKDWDEVGEYCDNDVESTEATFEARIDDYVAREILADISGLPVNSTTQQHTAKIVFGDNKKPQSEFVYTDLSEMFPGYTFELGKSHYKGELVGEGGYVYAEKGMYEDVALLDITSMHPTSIQLLNLFGEEFTKNFWALVQARIAIKRGNYEEAKKMLGGKLARHLNNPERAEALSYALKIVINIVYGLTSARFENAFRDPRNKDNIVAKRGALFMIDLKEFVQSKGFTVAHIKTDSIKIPNATKEIIDMVMEFGQQYGYEFEHEATYDKFCLVNDAVYIAKTRAGRKPAAWVATGAQFAHPYVYKTLFSKEPIEFRDKCEAKFVTTGLYLDFNEEERPKVSAVEAEDVPMALDETLEKYDASKLHFVGKAGLFCPIVPNAGGAHLMREKDGKFYAAAGSKGYYWLESDMVQNLGKEGDIDSSYFKKLVDASVDTISKYGDFEAFVS